MLGLGLILGLKLGLRRRLRLRLATCCSLAFQVNHMCEFKQKGEAQTVNSKILFTNMFCISNPENN